MPAQELVHLVSLAVQQQLDGDKDKAEEASATSNSTSSSLKYIIELLATGMVPDSNWAPDSYYCSITREVMSDPVITVTGHTYERAAIEEWLRDHTTDPATSK